MILRRRQRQHILAVHKGDERSLLAGKKLLDHHPVACFAKGPIFHNLINRQFGLALVLADHHALACGQSVSLDHTRRTDFINELFSGIRPIKGFVLSGRNIVFLQEVLAEDFAAFQFRRRCGWAEDAQFLGLEAVHDASR